MSDVLYTLCFIFLSIIIGVVFLRGKRVPGAVARSGAITNVMHKQNSPSDLLRKRLAEKRANFKTYKYSKRKKASGCKPKIHSF